MQCNRSGALVNNQETAQTVARESQLSFLFLFPQGLSPFAITTRQFQDFTGQVILLFSFNPRRIQPMEKPVCPDALAPIIIRLCSELDRGTLRLPIRSKENRAAV